MIVDAIAKGYQILKVGKFVSKLNFYTIPRQQNERKRKAPCSGVSNVRQHICEDYNCKQISWNNDGLQPFN